MITEYFLEKLGQKELEPEPSDSRYRCWNTGGVEREVGEFLYGLVRMIKPKNILETGTHKGIAASYMAQALKENESGHMETIEYEPSHVQSSKQRFNDLQLNEQITIYERSSIGFTPDKNYQIIFLDTEPQIRFQEFVEFSKFLEPGGIMMIHDLHPHMNQVESEHGFGWPYGAIPQEMKDLLNKEYSKVHFRTPRGLSLFYKKGPDDYEPSNN